MTKIEYRRPETYFLASRLPILRQASTNRLTGNQTDTQAGGQLANQNPDEQHPDYEQKQDEEYQYCHREATSKKKDKLHR